MRPLNSRVFPSFVTFACLNRLVYKIAEARIPRVWCPFLCYTNRSSKWVLLSRMLALSNFGNIRAERVKHAANGSTLYGYWPTPSSSRVEQRPPSPSSVITRGKWALIRSIACGCRCGCGEAMRDGVTLFEAEGNDVKLSEIKIPVKEMIAAWSWRYVACEIYPTVFVRDMTGRGCLK